MATAPDSVLVKFVLYEKERNIDVQRESDQFDDIIFVQGGTTTDYRSIVYKTFAFVQVRAVCCQYNAVTCKGKAVCLDVHHTLVITWHFSVTTRA